MKDPAFLLYSKDFQMSTIHMSACEVGAYIRLLLYQHQNGSIPNNTEKMMRITGVFTLDQWSEIWDTLSDKFTESTNSPNHLVNQRLTEEITKRATAKPKRVAAGCFAGLISSSTDLTKEQIKLIKKAFEIEDFISFPIDEIKLKIKDWFQSKKTDLVNQVVNNIGNVNGDGNANKDSLKEGYGEKTLNSKNSLGQTPIEVLKLNPMRFDQIFEDISNSEKLPMGLDHYLEKWSMSMQIDQDVDWTSLKWQILALRAKKYCMSCMESSKPREKAESESMDLSGVND